MQIARRLFLVSVFIVATPAATHAQPCTTRYGHYQTTKHDGYIDFMTQFDDDGPGPRPPGLYCAGSFDHAGYYTYATPLVPHLQGIGRWDASGWSQLGFGFSFPFGTGTVKSTCEYDEDGPGVIPPALIVGGNFAVAGGLQVNNIARWDGDNWSAMGSGFNFVVGAVAVFDEDGDGPAIPSLFAAGAFRQSGNTILNGIARWNGAEWVPVGGGLFQSTSLTIPTPGWATSLCIFDSDGNGPERPSLIVGGFFARCGSTLARNIAKWDGAAWRPLGAGCGTATTGTNVSELAVIDFDRLGPLPPRIVASGGFVSAGGVTASKIAMWDGSSWSSMGSGLNDLPNTMFSFDPDADGPMMDSLLVAGDYVTSAGGTPVPGFATWNGSAWAPLGNDRIENYGTACMYDADGIGPIPARLFATLRNMDELRYWNGIAWEIPGRALRNLNGTTLQANAMQAVRDMGSNSFGDTLIVAGDFDAVGSILADNIVAFRNGEWSALGSGTTDRPVLTLGMFDPDGSGPHKPQLLAGGEFSQICGNSARALAQWNGTSWSEFKSISSVIDAWSSVSSICEFDDDGPDGPAPTSLFVGGYINATIEGNPTLGILKWNGKTWSEVGGGLRQTSGGIPPSANSLIVFDADGPGPNPPSLIVAGRFDRAGTLPVRNIARWDGSSWYDVSGGLADYATCMAVYDTDGIGPEYPELYVGGFFHAAGLYPLSGATKLARWNGARWAAVGGGLNRLVTSLETFDSDGRGPHVPELYVAGEFSLAGGAPALGLARWDGQSWFGLDGGAYFTGISIRAMKAHRLDNSPSLFLCGNITHINQEPTSGFAHLRGCSPPALQASRDAVLP